MWRMVASDPLVPAVAAIAEPISTPTMTIAHVLIRAMSFTRSIWWSRSDVSTFTSNLPERSCLIQMPATSWSDGMFCAAWRAAYIPCLRA